MTTWFLWVKNTHPLTNEFFAQLIGEFRPEDELRHQLCADGQYRDLYRCKDINEVRCAVENAGARGLRFEVLRADPEQKPMRYELWKPEFRRKARMSRMRLA